MTRLVLLVLFCVLLFSKALSLDLSIGPGLSVKNALLYLVATMILLDAAVARNRKLEAMSVFVPFIALFLYAFATWLLIVMLFEYPHYDPRETLISLKSKLADQILVLLVFFYGVSTARDSVWLLKALTWAVVFSCLLTVMDTWNIPDLGIISARDDGRVEGIVGGSNEFGALLAFYLPAVVAVYWTASGAMRRLAMVGIFVSVTALLMTVSRGAFVGSLFGACIGLIYLRQYSSAKAIRSTSIAVTGLIILAVFALVATDFGRLLAGRMMQGVDSDGYTVSSGRADIWLGAIEMMATAPLTFITGFGWDAYFQSAGHRLSTHSTYVALLYNLGVIGVALFVAAAVNVMAFARRGMKGADMEARAFLAAVVVGTASLLVAMIFNDLNQPTILSWAFSGAALRLAAICGKDTIGRKLADVSAYSRRRGHQSPAIRARDGVV